MTEYQAIYKCRLCGEEYVSASTTSENVAIKQMLHATIGYKIEEWIGTPLEKNRMHSCKDGSMGVSDFLGLKKVKV